MNKKRCFILGSGPSIKQENLLLLKNEYTFCSNWFINHEQFSELNINYYCTYDEAFVNPNVNNQWLLELEKYPDIKKFFPEKWKTFLDNTNLSNIEYINYNPTIRIYESKIFNLNEKEGYYDGGTVIINLCIPLALKMGFEEIILIGCDTTYHTKNGLDAYFYSLDKHKTKFDESSERNTQWQNNVLNSYDVIAEYLTTLNNVRIFDATQNGKISCFDKIQLNQLFRN